MTSNDVKKDIALYAVFKGLSRSEISCTLSSLLSEIKARRQMTSMTSFDVKNNFAPCVVLDVV